LQRLKRRKSSVTKLGKMRSEDEGVDESSEDEGIDVGSADAGVDEGSEDDSDSP
jgi:hypothetical protein